MENRRTICRSQNTSWDVPSTLSKNTKSSDPGVSNSHCAKREEAGESLSAGHYPKVSRFGQIMGRNDFLGSSCDFFEKLGLDP